MQLFIFCNTLFSTAGVCNLTTYSILPLSTNVGLIGWVKDCPTLFDVLKEYRDRIGLNMNTEFNAMLAVAPNFEAIEGEAREEALIYGLSQTPGDDLKKVLLLNAADSSHWLARRNNFTESLAVTSMVGYILGLGDRHPGNIMMDAKTARLVHIDFGDCFEVAAYREHFPETVPFRMTRMFVKALEAAGVDGSLRFFSKDVLSLLRQNKVSISGLLETFVYDPLLQFAVTEKKTNKHRAPHELIQRVEDKLEGRDFGDKPLTVGEQVDRLISVATNTGNLCQMFKGWRPWW